MFGQYRRCGLAWRSLKENGDSEQRKLCICTYNSLRSSFTKDVQHLMFSTIFAHHLPQLLFLPLCLIHKANSANYMPVQIHRSSSIHLNSLQPFSDRLQMFSLHSLNMTFCHKHSRHDKEVEEENRFFPSGFQVLMDRASMDFLGISVRMTFLNLQVTFL